MPDPDPPGRGPNITQRPRPPTNATIVADEASANPGAPMVPAALMGLRTLGLGPAKITNAAPQPPPIRQKVSLRVNARNVADVRSEPWLQSPQPLGKPVVAGDRMVSVVIAARVTNLLWSAEKGVVIAEIDLVFAPITAGKIENDWAIRYVQDNEQLRAAIDRALHVAFSRLTLWPGLIVRFVGGPPMTEADARANRYHFWLNKNRSPTRVEIDDRGVQAAREAAEQAYLTAEQRWGLTRLTVAWWEWRDPIRHCNYLLGKFLEERGDVAELGKREIEALKTALSDPAGSVISSLSAVVFGDDLVAAEALKDKGRAPVTPTTIGERCPTFMEYEVDLPASAIAPLDDKA